MIVFQEEKVNFWDGCYFCPQGREYKIMLSPVFSNMCVPGN